MKPLGAPIVIQNTDGPQWFITWNDAVAHTVGESVSFTVAVPRSANLSISEVQRYAIKRAIELLQETLKEP